MCQHASMSLSEELVSSVCGAPIAANTSVPKDVGIYIHSLTPSWAVKSTFKKSSAPTNSVAISDSHVFAAQDQKAHVHVYSRQRGNQETFISFQERIKSVALSGDVLALGTAEGRLILWEVCCFSQICQVRLLLIISTDNHWTSSHHTAMPRAGYLLLGRYP